MAKQTALKPFALLLACYFMVSACYAQDAVDASRFFPVDLGSTTNITTQTEIFVDKTASLPMAEVLAQKFIPLNKFTRNAKIHQSLVSSTFYLKLHLANTSDSPVTGYFFPGTHYNKIDIYTIDGEPRRLTNTGKISGYRKLTLGAGEKINYLVELKMIKNYFNTLEPHFIQISNFEKFRKNYTYKTDAQLYGMIISGVVFMMILFMYTNYIVSKKSEFLYNGLYSLSIFLLLVGNSFLSGITTNFSNLYYGYLDFFLLVVGSIFYIFFLRKFLSTKTRYLLLDKFLKHSVHFVLLLLVTHTLFHFFTKSYLPQYYLENVVKILFLFVGVIFIWMAFTKKDRLFNYIAAGNIALVIFSILSLLVIIFNYNNRSLLYSSTFYYNTGVVIELSFFLMGLTYKNRHELIMGVKQQEALKQEAEKQGYETQIAVIKAEQEVKNRISADMHDDLGAGMTTISLYSELAKKRLGDVQIPEIEKISSSANELLNKMNAIIWSMSSSNDSLSNMIAYIRSYAIEYFEDTGIWCKITLPENLPDVIVNGEIRRNVFLVVKEALNNILKHSKATEVNIDLVRTKDGLTLYIQDNGMGINFEKIRAFGNGLKNMKKRMADFNIDFKIENKNGTLITLHRKIAAFNFS